MENEHAGDKKRILLADDDELIRAMYKDAFEREGFYVREAHNGKEALALVEEERPDLIVTDLMMPDMNGVEALKALKNNDETKDIPVIILTNYSEKPDYVEHAEKLGVFAFVMKSDTYPKEVLEKVRAALLQ